MTEAKSRGKFRMEGKECMVTDGYGDGYVDVDIVAFRFNV
jgi:hypothetical protein